MNASNLHIGWCGVRDFLQILDIILYQRFHEREIFWTEVDAIMQKFDVLLSNASLNRERHSLISII